MQLGTNQFGQKPAPDPEDPKVLASSPPAHHRLLAIGLIVAVVMALVAAAVTWWLINDKSAHKVADSINSQPTDDTKNIKKASFEAPTTLPVTYVKRDQNTTTSSTTYYTDAASGCSITTGGVALGGATGSTPKAAIVQSAASAEALGIKVVSSVDGAEIPLKDADGSKDYNFATLETEQAVGVQGVDFTKQNNVIAYKQFADKVMSISMSCRADNWVAKKPELDGLLRAFTIKTER